MFSTIYQSVWDLAKCQNASIAREKEGGGRINSLNFRLIASLIERNALNFTSKKKANIDKNREKLALGNNFKKS